MNEYSQILDRLQASGVIVNRCADWPLVTHFAKGLLGLAACGHAETGDTASRDPRLATRPACQLLLPDINP